MNEQRRRLRLGIITELVGRAPARLGRTAIMKLAYLLQTVKDVPLGYDFRLYTYGPFDSDVLNDLAQLESLGAVRSEMISFPSGYRYELAPGPKREDLEKKAGRELANYGALIRWALDEFGHRPAADLELISTIIYADREAAQQGRTVPFQELGHQVKEIKPHFTDVYIAGQVKDLAVKGLLMASSQEIGLAE